MSTPHPLDLLVRRLSAHSSLSEEDCNAIRALPFSMREVPPNSYIIREGEPPLVCGVLVKGYAFRQKLANTGERQIVSLHIPGEALDFQSLLLDQADHNVQALTRVTLAVLDRRALLALLMERGAVAIAAAKLCLIEASVSREWILNVGRRDARTRVAHLICEFCMRLEEQGLEQERFVLPMTQEQLGDATGLTSVHVNRTLKAIEKDGLIERAGREVRIPDLPALKQAGDFSELYLHF